MRVLLVWGLLALCVLLTAAATSTDGSESGNQSKNNIAQEGAAGSNKPSGRKKKCPGCYSALRPAAVRAEDIDQKPPPPRKNRSVQERAAGSNKPSGRKKKCPGCYTALRPAAVRAEDINQKPPPPRKNRSVQEGAAGSNKSSGRKKKCPGCYSSLLVPGAAQAEHRGQLRSVRQAEGKRRPPRPNAFTPLRKPRSAQEEPGNQSQPSRRRKKCPGCYSLVSLREPPETSSELLSDESAALERHGQTRDRRKKKDKNKDKGSKRNRDSAEGPAQEKPRKSGKNRDNKPHEWTYHHPGMLSAMARMIPHSPERTDRKELTHPGHHFPPPEGVLHDDVAEQRGQLRSARHVEDDVLTLKEDKPRRWPIREHSSMLSPFGGNHQHPIGSEGRSWRHRRRHRGEGRRRGRKHEDRDLTSEHPEDSEKEGRPHRHRKGHRGEVGRGGGHRHHHDAPWWMKRTGGGGLSSRSRQNLDVIGEKREVEPQA